MTTELTTAPIEGTGFTEDQKDLIKRTVAVGATDDELALFLHTAGRMGLDPLAKQVHAIKRWNAAQRREVMSIQVGIDGYRLVAHRTGEMDGYSRLEWCNDVGKWFDAWIWDVPPTAARVTVHRKGHANGYTAVALWDAYKGTKRDGGLTSMWFRMGPFMLLKCAEALALRMAFPAELSGVYTFEEMQQADNEPSQTPPGQPVPEVEAQPVDGTPPGMYPDEAPLPTEEEGEAREIVSDERAAESSACRAEYEGKIKRARSINGLNNLGKQIGGDQRLLDDDRLALREPWKARMGEISENLKGEDDAE